MPAQLGSTMNTYFIRLIPLPIFLYSLGQYLFLDRLSNQQNWVPQLIMWISLFYLFMPFKSIDNYVCKTIEKSDEITYESSSKNFIFDYESENPVQFSKDEFSEESEKEEGNIKLSNILKHRNFKNKTINLSTLIQYGQKQSLKNRIQEAVDLPKLFKKSLLLKMFLPNNIK